MDLWTSSAAGLTGSCSSGLLPNRGTFFIFGRLCSVSSIRGRAGKSARFAVNAAHCFQILMPFADLRMVPSSSLVKAAGLLSNPGL